jgi:hypothetical protein
VSKALAPLAALALLLMPAGPARAVIGTIDAVPAATLLLPYFEVDLTDPLGLTTVLSVSNAGPAPVIAHLTLWTDLSVPTLDFSIYLTGYDVQTMNLRDVFDGIVPITSDVDTGVSPVGVFSLTANPVTGVGPGAPGCDDGLPTGAMPPVLVDHIRSAHTGQGSPIVFGGQCSGVNYGDFAARGYVTIDSIISCSREFPGTAGYFIAGGQGVANNENVLLGDFAYANPRLHQARGETMVHLEASDALGPGDYTFYRRYAPAGEDQREGLGTTFWARYGAGDTDLVVWRDSRRTINPFTCGTTPPPFPLSQNQIVLFDEQETPEVPATSPFSPPLPGTVIPFAAEAQRTTVGGASLPASFASGWLYLDLNTALAASQVPFGPITQNWVVALTDVEGQFSVGFDAFQLDNVLAPLDQTLPICDGDPDPAACVGAVIFADGFESGNTLAWSLTAP